jgi:hypothetical protein
VYGSFSAAARPGSIATVSVLPGGAIQIGAFTVRSTFTSEGPTRHTLGDAVNSSAGWSAVTVQAAGPLRWSVVAVAANYRLERIVACAATRLEVNDTLVSTAQPGGAVLGLQVP